MPTDTERLDWMQQVDAEVQWNQTGWETSDCKVSNVWIVGTWKPSLREAIDASMEEDKSGAAPGGSELLPPN